MSVEQRGPAPTRAADERPRIVRPTPVVEPSHRQGSLSQPPADRQEVPLSYRIERTQLHARIAALEWLLEANERRRQAIVDQYEGLLADRTDAPDPSLCESPLQPRSVLSWLFDR